MKLIPTILLAIKIKRQLSMESPLVDNLLYWKLSQDIVARF